MDIVRDNSIVALYSISLLGPGPGELKVTFSRSELYREPHITFRMNLRGVDIRFIKKGETFWRETKFSHYVDAHNQNADMSKLLDEWKAECPESAPLTTEQEGWLESIGIEKINEKFRMMDAVIDLYTLLDE